MKDTKNVGKIRRMWEKWKNVKRIQENVRMVQKMWRGTKNMRIIIRMWGECE